MLPAPSQFEKWEARSSTSSSRTTSSTCARRSSTRCPGTLPEPEIHARLVRALGALDRRRPRAAARGRRAQGRAAFADAFFGLGGRATRLRRLLPVILYETLGPTLARRRRGGAALGLRPHGVRVTYPTRSGAPASRATGSRSARRCSTRSSRAASGVVFTVDDYDETLAAASRHPDGRVNLAIPELLDELARPAPTSPTRATRTFPFVLSAGERRSSTANTIFRDPAWRKKDTDGALRIAPDDAARLGIADGGRARVTTKRGSGRRVVEVTDTLQPGHVSLPNGLGLALPRRGRRRRRPRRRAERADRLRRSRLARRHAVAQARAGARRGGLTPPAAHEKWLVWALDERGGAGHRRVGGNRSGVREAALAARPRGDLGGPPRRTAE